MCDELTVQIRIRSIYMSLSDGVLTDYVTDVLWQTVVVTNGNLGLGFY